MTTHDAHDLANKLSTLLATAACDMNQGDADPTLNDAHKMGHTDFWEPHALAALRAQEYAQGLIERLRKTSHRDQAIGILKSATTYGIATGELWTDMARMVPKSALGWQFPYFHLQGVERVNRCKTGLIAIRAAWAKLREQAAALESALSRPGTPQPETPPAQGKLLRIGCKVGKQVQVFRQGQSEPILCAPLFVEVLRAWNNGKAARARPRVVTTGMERIGFPRPRGAKTGKADVSQYDAPPEFVGQVELPAAQQPPNRTGSTG